MIDWNSPEWGGNVHRFEVSDPRKALREVLSHPLVTESETGSWLPDWRDSKDGDPS